MQTLNKYKNKPFYKINTLAAYSCIPNIKISNNCNADKHELFLKKKNNRVIRNYYIILYCVLVCRRSIVTLIIKYFCDTDNRDRVLFTHLEHNNNIKFQSAYFFYYFFIDLVNVARYVNLSYSLYYYYIR